MLKRRYFHVPHSKRPTAAVLGWELTSVHPETATLRTAKAFGDTDEKRNLLIHKPYDDAALCGPAVITAKKLRFWTGTNYFLRFCL